MWWPGLLRPVVVKAATVVRPTMGLGTRKSNQGSHWNRGRRSQRNQMSELDLVI